MNKTKLRGTSTARNLSRRDFLKGLAAMSFAAGAGLGIPGRQALAHTAAPAGLNALEHRTYESLTDFTAWLKKTGARGYIGEVGWPSNSHRELYNDELQWKSLANKWYSWADDAGLWVTAHDANERQLWGGYDMSIYTSSGRDRQRAICEPKIQAAVVEAHCDTSGYGRGLNVPSGQNIDRNTFHQGNLGNFNEAEANGYWYSGIASDGPDGKNTFEYLYSRGIRVVRLGFRWERFMPKGPDSTALDQVEVGRYRESLNAAGAAGLRVIVDVHNYGGYYFAENGRGVRHPINSSKLPIKYFKQLWALLSTAFRDHPAVIAYDLMNEPYNDGGIVAGRYASEELAWQATTQQVVNMLRRKGDKTLIMVPTYGGAGRVQKSHAKPWIKDPASNHMYTAHQYFDSFRGPGTGGGQYKFSYDDEVGEARSRGF